MTITIAGTRRTAQRVVDSLGVRCVQRSNDVRVPTPKDKDAPFTAQDAQHPVDNKSTPRNVPTTKDRVPKVKPVERRNANAPVSADNTMRARSTLQRPQHRNKPVVPDTPCTDNDVRTVPAPVQPNNRKVRPASAGPAAEGDVDVRVEGGDKGCDLRGPVVCEPRVPRPPAGCTAVLSRVCHALWSAPRSNTPHAPDWPSRRSDVVSCQQGATHAELPRGRPAPPRPLPTKLTQSVPQAHTQHTRPSSANQERTHSVIHVIVG